MGNKLCCNGNSPNQEAMDVLQPHGMKPRDTTSRIGNKPQGYRDLGGDELKYRSNSEKSEGGYESNHSTIKVRKPRVLMTSQEENNLEPPSFRVLNEQRKSRESTPAKTIEEEDIREIVLNQPEFEMLDRADQELEVQYLKSPIAEFEMIASEIEEVIMAIELANAQ